MNFIRHLLTWLSKLVSCPPSGTPAAVNPVAEKSTTSRGVGEVWRDSYGDQDDDSGGVVVELDPIHLVDLERSRAAEIVAACCRAGKPSLALTWICAGRSLCDVQKLLIQMVVREGGRPAEEILSEFDQGAWIYAAFDVSQESYLRWRTREEREWLG